MKILKTKIRNTMSQQNLCGQFVLKIIIINETKNSCYQSKSLHFERNNDTVDNESEIHPHNTIT